MGTKDFNLLDNMIASLRLHKVLSYIEKEDIVLDFGCGHQALFLISVKQRIKKGVGLDYDVEKTTIDNIELIKYNFTDKLPFKNSSFTKIFLLAVLEHVPTNKIKILFREFNRILKKNGKIVITTPTPESQPLLELLAYKFRIISEVEIRDHKKYYSIDDIKIISVGSKFKIAKYKKFELGLNSLCILNKL